ncbi:MAG: GNAT family N-acetyltransferase [Colwellia sp.]|nr:GNAT family N-acetyltransferase [Colwellia sp.]
MFTYKQITLVEFLNHQVLSAPLELFELSQTWLLATEQFMLPNNAEVIVHCMFDKEQLVVTWPLVHHSDKVFSLTSFYSAITQVYYSSKLSGVTKTKVFHQLIEHINSQGNWDQMLLGPISQFDESALIIEKTFKYQRIYNQSVNFFESNIQSFEHYHTERPSQLRNTIKRREKKLSRAHKYHIEIITSEALFDKYFVDYQDIYQQSWKGEEYSFDFIEQVCLQAIRNNQLRMGMLFVDDQPAAVQIWFIQGESASIFKLAYSTKYQEFSVGSILSLALSKHVIDEDKVTVIEFGMGNERYKKDWMTQQRHRIVYQVFNHRTLRGNLAAVKYLLLVKVKTKLMTLFR